MTKKDYIVFARMIKELKSEGVDAETIDRIIKKISSIFWDDNTNFNNKKFIDFINK